MYLNKQITGYLERASWIRKMFEKGRELKQKYGQDRVYDFSLGNPDLPPPPGVITALEEVKERAKQPLGLGYMPNAGFPELRERLAAFLSKEQGVKFQAEDVVITCGAAGGINALLRALLEPGEEVVTFAPYFVEYGFYAENHQGKLRVVKTLEPDFALDMEGLARAISKQTRVVLINSPNNPSGQIISEEELGKISEVLTAKSKEIGHPIFLVADEPYRFLTYEGALVPSIFKFYPYSVVVSSFSKSLGLAGERIGYVAVNPQLENKEELVNGLILTNRILGFVNAPVIGQYLLLAALGEEVDKEIYYKRRRLMGEILEEAGLNFTWPRGGFYFFPQAPDREEGKFIDSLLAERVLAVPGTGFGYPGYVRFAFCVPEEVISRAREPILRAVEKLS